MLHLILGGAAVYRFDNWHSSVPDLQIAEKTHVSYQGIALAMP
jgi:hypothetical protein